MVQVRFTWWLEHNNKIPPSQFDFRKKRSCLDNLITHTSTIHSSFSSGAHTLALFLDIKGVFDNVDPSTLTKLLCDSELPPSICKFFYNLTPHREIFFKNGDQTIRPLPAIKGLPQGCLSSFALYNFYTSKLNDHLSNNCQVLSFADDVVFFLTTMNLDQGLRSLQLNLFNINRYFNSIGLPIAPDWTIFMVFSCSSVPDNLTIELGGTVISWSLQAKFLDSKWNWQFQIRFMIKNSNIS